MIDANASAARKKFPISLNRRYTLWSLQQLNKRSGETIVVAKSQEVALRQPPFPAPLTRYAI